MEKDGIYGNGNKKTISIIKRNNIKKQYCFFFFFALSVIQWFKTKNIFESHKKYVKANVFLCRNAL